MLVNKTVTEWLAYVKLETKKLNKRREELLKGAFEVRLKEKDPQLTEEGILSSYKSLKVIEDNISIVRDRLSVFNASTIIKVAGREMTLANALHLRKKVESGDTEELAFFKKLYKDLTSQKNRVENDSEYKINDLERTILNKANATKTDREMVDLKKADLAVVILDPLKIEEKLSQLTEENEEFITDVDVKINLVNATSTFELELKD